jgi:hypothetical protein
MLTSGSPGRRKNIKVKNKGAGRPTDLSCCVQIVQAIAARHERPEIPEDISSLPGGTFCAIEDYLDLIKRCWADDLAERPTFQIIILELSGMMDKQTQMARASAARSADIFAAPRRQAPPPAQGTTMAGVRDRRREEERQTEGRERRVKRCDRLTHACKH